MDISHILRCIRKDDKDNPRYIIDSSGNPVDTRPDEKTDMDFGELKPMTDFNEVEVTHENAIEAFSSVICPVDKKKKALLLHRNPSERARAFFSEFNVSHTAENREIMKFIAGSEEINQYIRVDAMNTLYRDAIEFILDENMDPMEITPELKDSIDLYHELIRSPSFNLPESIYHDIVYILISNRHIRTADALESLLKACTQTGSPRRALHLLKRNLCLLNSGECDFFIYHYIESLMKAAPYIEDDLRLSQFKQGIHDASTSSTSLDTLTTLDVSSTLDSKIEDDSDEFVLLNREDIGNSTQYLIEITENYIIAVSMWKNTDIDRTAQPHHIIEYQEILRRRYDKLNGKPVEPAFRYSRNGEEIEEYYLGLCNVAVNTKIPVHLRADAADMLLRTKKWSQYGANFIALFGNSKTPYQSNESAHLIDVRPIITKLISRNEQDLDVTKEWTEFYMNIIHSDPDPRLVRAIIRISIDPTTYGPSRWTSMEAIVRAVRVIRESPNSVQMYARLIEELKDAADTCGSGHFNRILNALSGFDGFFSQISLEKSMQYRVRGIINEYAKDDPNLLLAMADTDVLKNDNFKAFLRSNLSNVISQVTKEYLEMNYTESDIRDAAAMAIRYYMNPETAE